ncbi:MAG TPA: rhomboid family intramembrane serine protease [Allosphingosinicella sp.]|nr:rhomboid family intramembrane serine protease [Allosphingosinicella sp.]
MRPPDGLRAAPVTLGIALVTAAAWLIVRAGGWGQEAVAAAGFVPARLGGLDAGIAVPALLTPLSKTLVHGGFAHLFFNLVFLLVCGRAVERIVGGTGLLILYVAGAYASSAATFLAVPASEAASIGASGAISAVIGAYAILFSRQKVKIRNPRLAALANALWLAAAWIGLQLLVGLTVPLGGVRMGIEAHIGGFLAGMILAKPLLLLKWRGA